MNTSDGDIDDRLIAYDESYSEWGFYSNGKNIYEINPEWATIEEGLIAFPVDKKGNPIGLYHGGLNEKRNRIARDS